MRDKDDPPLGFARAQTTYPDANTSRRLIKQLAYPWSANWLGWRNPGFPAIAAGVHAIVFVILSLLCGFTKGTTQPFNAVQSAGLDELGGFVGPGLGGIALLLLIGWIGRWVRTGKPSAQPSSTAIAVLMQIAVALIVLVVTVALPWPADWPGWWVLGLCLMIAGVLGAGLGSEAFALYILSARSGQVVDWQMSGQSVEDHKGFLRLHIGPEGDLTIYPLAIDEVCHDWELVDDPAGGKRPVPAAPLPSPRLIETPVVVAREVSSS
jgi:hypothetical protein